MVINDYFYGTKRVKAEPMTRGEYNIFRGWELPANENGEDPGFLGEYQDGEDPGFLVEYQDGGKPNVEGRDGYVSWSPFEQFVNAYVSEESLASSPTRFSRTLGNVEIHYVYNPVTPTPVETQESADIHALPDCEMNVPGYIAP